MTALSVVHMILALGFVLVMILGFSLLLKRVQRKVQAQGDLFLKSSIALDQKRRACILRAQDREILVILGLSHEHVIELPGPLPVLEKDDGTPPLYAFQATSPSAGSFDKKNFF